MMKRTMYHPFEEQQAQSALRLYEREIRLASRYQKPLRGLAGAFVLIAVTMAIAFNGRLHGGFVPAILLGGLALAALVGSISTFNRTGIFSGFYGFVWLLGLALCSLVGFWPWILLPVVASMILGSLFKLILRGPAGASFLANLQPRQQGEQVAPAQQHGSDLESGRRHIGAA